MINEQGAGGGGLHCARSMQFRRGEECMLRLGSADFVESPEALRVDPLRGEPACFEDGDNIFTRCKRVDQVRQVWEKNGMRGHRCAAFACKGFDDWRTALCQRERAAEARVGGGSHEGGRGKRSRLGGSTA